jgi:hypothetical protein
MTQDATEGIKHVTDAVSVLTVIGTLAQILPAIAALFTIIWTGFRILETATVREWLGKPPLNK